MQASVHDAKTNLSKLIDAAERGEQVVITRHGKPAVQLVPASKSAVQFGSLKTKLAPPTDAFLADLSDDELSNWGA